MANGPTFDNHGGLSIGIAATRGGIGLAQAIKAAIDRSNVVNCRIVGIVMVVYADAGPGIAGIGDLDINEGHLVPETTADHFSLLAMPFLPTLEI
jgi:hypothetical protein